MLKTKYTITFKDGRKKEIFADRWITSPTPDPIWMMFLKDELEILRVVISEIRMVERRLV